MTQASKGRVVFPRVAGHNVGMGIFFRALSLHPVAALHRDPHMLLAVSAALPMWALLWVGRGTPGLFPQGFGWAYVYLILLVPMVEELAFRGALMGWFLETDWGPRRALGISAANGVTSVLFGAVHLIHQPPMWAVGVLIPSLLFGHLRERHNSVLPAFLLHAWYNAGFFAISPIL